jgi:branched-chain amino acid transport system ATP-binding protein
LSAAMMGAAGSIWAQSVIAFDANQFFFALTFSTLAMLVIGGRASVTGAVAGAAIVTFVSDTLSRVEQGVAIGPWQLPRITGTVQFVIALLIIFMLIWRPEGLFDRWEVDDLIARLSPARRRARRGDVVATRSAPEPDRPATVEVADPRDREVVLRGAGVAKNFDGISALAGVDIDVRAGEILGLIGPNGCGKSTLFNCILGQLTPTGGEVKLDGKVVTGLRPAELNKLGVSRTFQLLQVFPKLSVRENLILAGQEHQGNMASRLVGRSDAGLTETANQMIGFFKLDHLAAEPAGGLSYGQQKLLDAAMAFMGGPRLVLLDEPAGGVNPSMLSDLKERLVAINREKNATFVVIEHNMEFVMSLCSRVMVMAEGKVLAMGRPDEVRANPAVIEAYLGH